MCYLMSVVATEKQTTINVELVKPVGMLRHQQYCYRIIPQGESTTVITISHELDVVLISRKLQLVNRIISKVTYKKACEELHTLTGKMVDSVYCIANREKPKTDASNKNSSNNDDEEVEEAVDEDAMKDASNSDRKNDEPPEESKKIDVGDSPSESPEVSAALKRNDSPMNLAGSNASESSPPIPDTPAENRERTSDKDTAIDLTPVERSSSEARSAQTPRSENSTPVVSGPVTPKGPAASTSSETERTKGKSDASLSPLVVPSPTQSNTPSPAQQEPNKPKSTDLRVVIEVSRLHQERSGLRCSQMTNSSKPLMLAKTKIVRGKYSRKLVFVSRKAEHWYTTSRAYPMDRTRLPHFMIKTATRN